MRNKKLDLYLANLGVLNGKVHNLHWNVVGKNFAQVHGVLEEIYDDLFGKFDMVAEYQKIRGIYPLASYKEYLEISTVEELSSQDYSTEESLNIVLEELKGLKNLILEIRKETEDFMLSNMMEDHAEDFEKKIWFIESSLK